MGIPHVKRVENRLQLLLVVYLHSTVGTEVAPNEVLVKEGGDILPLAGCDFWGCQSNEDCELSRSFDFSFFGQQLAVIDELVFLKEFI